MTWNARVDNQAAVTAVAAKILDDTTVLGVTGTIAAAEVVLGDLGELAASFVVLSGCNIGTAALGSDPYSFEGEHGLDLSSNRMNAAALQTLIEDIYGTIEIGESGATLTLDISGNAEPNAATITKIEALVLAGCTITYEGM